MVVFARTGRYLSAPPAGASAGFAIRCFLRSFCLFRINEMHRSTCQGMWGLQTHPRWLFRTHRRRKPSHAHGACIRAPEDKWGHSALLAGQPALGCHWDWSSKVSKKARANRRGQGNI